MPSFAIPRCARAILVLVGAADRQRSHHGVASAGFFHRISLAAPRAESAGNAVCAAPKRPGSLKTRLRLEMLDKTAPDPLRHSLAEIREIAERTIAEIRRIIAAQARRFWSNWGWRQGSARWPPVSPNLPRPRPAARARPSGQSQGKRQPPHCAWCRHASTTSLNILRRLP